MSTIRKEYGSIFSSSKPGDDRRHSFREIVEDELQLITNEVQTLTHASLRLNNQAITDPDRLHRDPAAGTATIPSEVANMSEYNNYYIELFVCRCVRTRVNLSDSQHIHS